MGKFKSCRVNFKQGKDVFQQGELVSGVVVMEVTERVEVKGIRVYCTGRALTKWTKDFSRDLDTNQIGSETYYAEVLTIFGKKLREEGPNRTLEAGKHRWAFSFRLPAEGLPSSFEGKYGAIRWLLKVEVDKPFPSINNKWYHAFTVLSRLDMNEPGFKSPQKKLVSKTVSKALGVGNAGTLTLRAQTDHFGYCPGESIILTVEVKNESSKDMGRVSASLIQRVAFTANAENQITNYAMSTVETEQPVAKGTTMTLKDIHLPVPAVPPSTLSRSCHIITCYYFVKVCVNVPWGLDLEAEIAVAIGTIPRGKKVPPPRQSKAEAAAAEADPATQIKYVKCETGITPCTRSTNTFPNFPFTPSTAYVANCTPTRAPILPVTAPLPPSQQQEASASASSQASASAANAKAREALSAPPPAPLGEEVGALRPPDYEDVVRMDEGERLQAAAQASTSKTPAPKGKECYVMAVRFPDSSLASFRHTIQREQNNLSDNGEAFLAALSAQPLSGIDKASEEWPDQVSLALLVFPDAASGEEWVREVEERGDAWYPHCDIVMAPASWNVPPDSTNRLVFTLSLIRMKEDASKKRVAALAKNILPLFAKLRQKMGGERQALSKKTTLRTLHGGWVTSDYSLSLMHWPKFGNYIGYYLECHKGEFAKHSKEVEALFETHTTLLISEDLTSLSTQPTASPDDDDADDDDDDVDNADNEGEGAENLLLDSAF